MRYFLLDKKFKFARLALKRKQVLIETRDRKICIEAGLARVSYLTVFCVGNRARTRTQTKRKMIKEIKRFTPLRQSYYERIYFDDLVQQELALRCEKSCFIKNKKLYDVFRLRVATFLSFLFRFYFSVEG